MKRNSNHRKKGRAGEGRTLVPTAPPPFCINKTSASECPAAVEGGPDPQHRRADNGSADAGQPRSHVDSGGIPDKKPRMPPLKSGSEALRCSSTTGGGDSASGFAAFQSATRPWSWSMRHQP